MFLKRIEMQGFKSFADHITINFDDPVTGIVGPNGCGKSNISDAVRWVLGEQSVKSLRGEKMTDVIFAGSETRKAVNLAEVTLVFDNSNHILNSDLEEIEVTRRIYNTEQDAEYLINRNHVRLKDVVDLILDSGLGKDSLSIISQGNITQFADAKPYDRRGVFEDAAGVSKYKKRKIESLNRLERTKENLDRTNDILQELEKQVAPLRRQAKKAEIYREKKKRLEEIETAVLVDEIRQFNESKEELDHSLFDLETKLAMTNTTIQVNENNNLNSKATLREMEREVNQIQERLVATLNEIQKLETRKVEIDEKRKYAIEMGSSEEKIKEMKNLLAEAEYEYKDRLERFNTLSSELKMLNENLSELSVQLADASLKKEETANRAFRLENRISVLENIIKDPFSSNAQSGVKAIMSNSRSFYGVLGVVGQVLIPDENYEYALASALANAVYNIITKDEAAARNCVNFLKKNKSGRATFLPLNVLKSHDIKYEDEIICNNTKGYVGVMADFVTNEPEFDIVRDGLLGNIVVCDTLENANNLAALLKYNYKIVTLDGEIVHKGGFITGGKVKNETSIVTAQAELEQSKEKLISYKAEAELCAKEFEKIVLAKTRVESELTEKRIQIAQVEPLVDVKRAKYEKMKNDYEMINPNNEENQESFSDEIVVELSKAYSLKDELSTSLKIKRDEKMKLSSEIDRRDQQLRQLRRQVEESNASVLKVSKEKAALEIKLENNLNRLASEYQMTYEYALAHNEYEITGSEREEVNQLRSDIASLGNVNMSAPEEYEEVNNRYEFLKKN
ncbi:MAG: AAA family ATPase, partial [Erysipelotrichaceae bacterium]|nr:AAA family ATPase [Erysipelotrichaceae bacterium]